jgi:hypothetical protein
VLSHIVQHELRLAWVIEPALKRLCANRDNGLVLVLVSAIAIYVLQGTALVLLVQQRRPTLRLRLEGTSKNGDFRRIMRI